MRVNDYGNPSVLAFNLTVHLCNCLGGEVEWIEIEVLVVTFIVLVGPLDVHPQDVDWEIVLGEQPVSFNHNVRTHPIPLAKVEAKHVEQRHRHITCDDRKVFLNLFDTVGGTVCR
jgi:hypothetical protein